MAPWAYSQFDSSKWIFSYLRWDSASGNLTLASIAPEASNEGSDIFTMQSWWYPDLKDMPIIPGFWRLGVGYSYYPGFSGEMDDFCFFNAVLTENDLVSIKNNGCSINGNLKTHLSFDKDGPIVPESITPNVYDEVRGKMFATTIVTKSKTKVIPKFLL